MARPKKTDDGNTAIVNDTMREIAETEQKMAPEDAMDAQERPAVEDLPPANPLGEPIDGEYPEGKYAELTAGTLKPAETVVEHPLSPTDTNPNPHGQRSQPTATIAEKDENGVEHRKPADEEVAVKGWLPQGVHVGDGRIIAHNETLKVGKDQAKDLAKAKKDQGY